MTRDRRRRASTQERREQFLDAAVTVIRRDGPAASMEQLAREAGVTKPILYRVFGDRDGLLKALGERFAAELAEGLGRALDAESLRIDPKAQLTAAIDAFVSLIERDPHLYRFLTERLGGSSDDPIGGLTDEISRNISVLLGERLRQLGADSGAAEPWAYGLVGMVHLAGDWWVKRQTMPRERLVAYLVALVWDGLAGLDPDAAGDGPSPSADLRGTSAGSG
jgi:AcrR family transcriptional regulator